MRGKQKSAFKALQLGLLGKQYVWKQRDRVVEGQKDTYVYWWQIIDTGRKCHIDRLPLACLPAATFR